MIADAVERVTGRLEARGVEVVVAPDLPIVMGDRGRLVQVFQNLIENAAKYAGDQPSPRVEVGTRADPAEALVFVLDNGKGIEPRHLDGVFELFEKLDPRSEDTGVGLALVKRIVEFHGGRVWAESEGAGRGSTFVVALPLDRSPSK